MRLKTERSIQEGCDAGALLEQLALAYAEYSTIVLSYCMGNGEWGLTMDTGTGT